MLEYYFFACICGCDKVVVEVRMSTALSIIFWCAVVCFIVVVLMATSKRGKSGDSLMYGSMTLAGFFLFVSVIGGVSLYLSRCFSGDTAIAVGFSFFFGMTGYSVAVLQDMMRK